jgi:hypothetical protein
MTGILEGQARGDKMSMVERSQRILPNGDLQNYPVRRDRKHGKVERLRYSWYQPLGS